MKYLYYLITGVLLLVGFVKADALDTSELKRQVNAVLADRREKGVDTRLDKDKLKDLRLELRGNRSNVWNLHPEITTSLQKEIEPLRSLAIELAHSQDAHERYHAVSLLAYLEPSEVTKGALFNLAWDENSATAVTSLDTIFGMKWDTPELREKIVDQLENKLAGKSYRGFAVTGVGKWGVSEAVPVLIKILEKSYEDQSFKGKFTLRQFRYLGTEAAEALPVLEKILEERKRAEDADFRELEALEYAVAAVKNGGIRQQSWRDLEQANAGQKRVPKPSGHGRNDRITNSQKKQQHDTKEEHGVGKKKNRLPWVIVGVLVVGILALLFKGWKGK